MNKINFGSNEDFIAKYEELKSSRKMGEYYNCSKTTILKHAKDIGYNVDSNKKYKLSEEQRQEILNSYYTSTSNELAKKFNVSRGMITKIWYDAGLSGKTISITKTTKIDLTNQTFGYMKVIKESSKRGRNGNVYWTCKCLKCGAIKDADSATLRNGKVISCGCIGKENLKIGQGLNFDDKTGKVFGKLTVIEQDFEKSKPGAVFWKCKCKCGRETSVLAINLATGNTQSCGSCGNKSHGNLKIEKLLSDANISFEREKRFADCKDKSYLPFDFYVNNEYLIEFDGIQHFEDVGFFDHEKTHQHDLIKNKWCKDHQVPLIRIPYTILLELTLEDLKLETSKYIVK